MPLAIVATAAALITPFGAVASGEAELSDHEWAQQILVDAGIHYSGEIVIYDELIVAGQQAAGYVPMLNDEDRINLVSSAKLAAYGSVETVFRSVVLHEYAHILQKRVIEAHCGDYYAARAVCVSQLNELLAGHIEDAEESPSNTLLAGLETSADCILDTFAENQTNIHGYQVGDCSTRQLASALAIRAGEWPDIAAVERWTAEAKNLEKSLNKLGLARGLNAGYFEKELRTESLPKLDEKELSH